MNRLIRNIIFTVLLALTACNKKPIDLNIHDSEELVVSGVLSDSNQHQEIRITHSSAIGFNNYQPIPDANITIRYNTNLYTFTYKENGLYASDSIFAMAAGKAYELSFERDTLKFTKSSLMPHAISIDSLELSVVEFSNRLSAVISLSSPVDQFCMIELDEYRIDTLSGDTTFNAQLLDQTSIHPVGAGSESINLLDPNDYFVSDSNFVIKANVYALSKDVGEYLTEMKNYHKNQSTTNLFINPPPYFPKGVYGLIYGTSVSEITIGL